MDTYICIKMRSWQFLSQPVIFRRIFFHKESARAQGFFWILCLLCSFMWNLTVFYSYLLHWTKATGSVMISWKFILLNIATYLFGNDSVNFINISIWIVIVRQILSIGGFPIKIETEKSLLISCRFAIFSV